MKLCAAGDLDYACARISARFGARPDEVSWRRIETVRDLAAMLDAARATALRPWTGGISPETDSHAVERGLRIRWRSLANEVAAWMPARWQAAVAWSALVPDLAALDFLRRGENAPFWFANDPLYKRWNVSSREIPPTNPSALAMAQTVAELAAAWVVEWRRRLPSSHQHDAPQLARFGRIVAGYFAEMRAAPPGDASPMVRTLRERLETLYRRAMQEPTAAFVYLALAALDLARLRGEVMRRLLFPRLALAP